MACSLLRAVCTLLFITSASALAQYHIDSAPAWVKPIQMPAPDSETVPTAQLSNGIYYRLVDDQFHIPANDSEPQSHYIRYAKQATNNSAVESVSQINLNFDPSYQAITIHRLDIIRDGQTINKLDSAKMEVLRRESDAERLIYDGRKTVNIILDDVRIGDTIDYAYTLAGRNPIYDNKFSYALPFNWSVPVAHQAMRVVWLKDTPLYTKQINGSLPIKETQLAQGTEFYVEAKQSETRYYNSQTPTWFDPYHSISFSEFSEWSEVVNWALPMYTSAISDTADVKLVSDTIKQEFNTLDAQIGAALKYTQDEIRYLGLEMGVNSHQPTPAHETLALRYGDCKDKVVLLISLLKSLGIEAYPALVNTELNKALIDSAPSASSFDHVVVTFEHNQERYWLDPTVTYQTGALTHLYEPDFGYALIVKEGESALVSMYKNKAQVDKHIVETYNIPEDTAEPVTFSVHSTLKDSDAIEKRRELAQQGKEEAQRSYTNYYQNYFAGTRHTHPMNIAENPNLGEIEVTEFYAIDTFWEDEENALYAYFYADEIQAAAYEPEESARVSPLSLRFPYTINYDITLNFAQDGWAFDNSNTEINNEFFNLTRQVNFENDTLTLSFKYRAKTDHVPVNKLGEYLEARAELDDLTSYGIKKNKPGASAYSDSEVNFAYAILYYFGFAAVALILFILIWRYEVTKRPTFEQQVYYPVSVPKFYIYSVLSLGVFPFYWCYKNWQWIKTQHQEDVMPFVRGFFAWIWFYPLYSHMKRHEADFKPASLAPTWLAVIAAVAIIGLQLSMRLGDIWVYTLVLSPLPWLLLVSYVEQLNRDNEALHYHSRWRLRQALVLVATLPMITLIAAQETKLIPSSEIMAGDELWQHDKAFMLRQQIITPTERIVYFYGDALLSYREDGNGVTNEGVFSYYVERGKLQIERATYADIKNIETTFADDGSDNNYTVIDIERHDGSQFRLLLLSFENRDNKFVQEIMSRWQLAKSTQNNLL